MVFMASPAEHADKRSRTEAQAKRNGRRWKQNKIKSKFIALNKWHGMAGQEVRERETRVE